MALIDTGAFADTNVGIGKTVTIALALADGTLATGQSCNTDTQKGEHIAPLLSLKIGRLLAYEPIITCIFRWPALQANAHAVSTACSARNAC